MESELAGIAVEDRPRPDVLSTPLPAADVERLLGELAAAGIPARHEERTRDTHDYTGAPCVSEGYSVFLVPAPLADRARTIVSGTGKPGPAAAR
jgi:hypothetical protein